MKRIILLLSLYSFYGCAFRDYSDKDIGCAEVFANSHLINENGIYRVDDSGFIPLGGLQKVRVFRDASSCNGARIPVYVEIDSSGFRLAYDGAVDDNWGLYLSRNGKVEMDDIKRLEWIRNGIYKYSTMQ